MYENREESEIFICLAHTTLTGGLIMSIKNKKKQKKKKQKKFIMSIAVMNLCTRLFSG